MAATPPAARISTTPIPNLYISDLTAPNDTPLLHHHNITHVVSLTSARDLPTLPRSIQHLHLPIEDNPYEDIVCLLEGVYCWIDAALTLDQAHTQDPAAGTGEAANVLVHCVQGQSRSGAVVTAYVMRALGLRYEAALAKVRDARPSVLLNSGFAEQLRVWEGLRYSVYAEVEGGRVKEEYVAWKENRGILMSGAEREKQEGMREEMRGVVVRVGRGSMEKERV
jgi:predicted protein tyrosine phosphatase